MDFEQFFNIYIKPRSSGQLNRDGIEFRYTAASILIACSKADLDEHPEELKMIRQILADTFGVPDGVADRLLEVGETASDDEYLKQITTFVNNQFSHEDKQFLLEKLWMVALADNKIDKLEEDFIRQVAEKINLGSMDIISARSAAENQFR
ncbi:MAG: TerB family tellurite resistance protein [Pseudomonadales bacterium]|nr:TerB family tellurite resistance protein [Pseudomonadales bacterium]